MTTAIVDIETNGLGDTTKIHCIVAREEDSGKEKVWIKEQCADFGEWSKKINKFIMHNGISFDAPLLNKFTGSAIRATQIRDTLLESQLFNPIREGGHSLESWGKKLKFLKGEHKDFTVFTKEMLQYCRRDAELTGKVASTLLEEGERFPSRPYELERKVSLIVDHQEKNGFAFNLPEAMILLAQLEDEQFNLEKQSLEIFPPKIFQLKTKTKEEPFNIASRKQIAERLMEKGWKPTKKTDKGNIIINEEVLDKIKIKEAKMFSRYFLLQKRTGLLKSWIKECQEDGRVRGKVLTLRTVTGRMAHHSPNMAQVPAVYSPYGKECRSLWTVTNPDTHVLVGTDASSLELRCLAHYLDDRGYINEVVNGDIHTANQRAAGLKTRDQAKTFIYAFLYGAGPVKLGQIVGGGAAQGANLIKRFLDNVPNLKTLRENIQEAAKAGPIRGVDGRLLQIRSVHSSVNTLLQGAGAIICKEWLIHMDKYIREVGVDVKLVASIHDEYQFEVAKKDVNRFGLITKSAMKDAERSLKIKCPLDCEYKAGRTWGETH